MSGASLALTVLQGAIFLVWTVVMLRSLFGILARFRADTGRRWIGPVAVWGVFGRYLTDPLHRGERKLLGWTTLALIAATLSLAIFRTG